MTAVSISTAESRRQQRCAAFHPLAEAFLIQMRASLHDLLQGSPPQIQAEEGGSGAFGSHLADLAARSRPTPPSWECGCQLRETDNVDEAA